MKNLCVLGKLRRITVNTVTETGTDCNYKVTFCNTHVACISSVHTNHPCTQRMSCRETVAGHKTFTYRNLSFFCKFKELCFCTRDFYSTASINDWLLRVVYKFSCSLKFLFVWSRNCNCALKVCLVQSFKSNFIRIF